MFLHPFIHNNTFKVKNYNHLVLYIGGTWEEKNKTR